MPLPPLAENGWLPPGIYEASLEEVESRFGIFQSSDVRTNLMKKLKQFVEEARSSRIIRYIIVNGSFISAKEKPDDIDIIVVLPKDHKGEVLPFEYNLINKKRVRNKYGFDIFAVSEGHKEYHNAIKLFQMETRSEIDSKGIVKVQL